MSHGHLNKLKTKKNTDIYSKCDCSKPGELTISLSVIIEK